jgi:hypothetical protein
MVVVMFLGGLGWSRDARLGKLYNKVSIELIALSQEWFSIDSLAFDGLILIFP